MFASPCYSPNVIAALSVIGFALSGWTAWTGLRLIDRHWASGMWLLLAGLLGIGAQLALSLIPVGIGEPIIRIRERELWPVAAAGAALVALAAILTRHRRGHARFWPILSADPGGGCRSRAGLGHTRART